MEALHMILESGEQLIRREWKLSNDICIESFDVHPMLDGFCTTKSDNNDSKTQTQKRIIKKK